MGKFINLEAWGKANYFMRVYFFDNFISFFSIFRECSAIIASITPTTAINIIINRAYDIFLFPPYLSKLIPKKRNNIEIKNPIIIGLKSNFTLGINWFIIKLTYVSADILKKYLLKFFFWFLVNLIFLTIYFLYIKSQLKSYILNNPCIIRCNNHLYSSNLNL